QSGYAQSPDSLFALNLSQVNTAASEFAPLLSPDGSTFYFIRESDMFKGYTVKFMQCSVREDGYLTDPIEVEKFKKLKNYCCFTMDDAGEIFFFYYPANASSGSPHLYELDGNDVRPLDSVNSIYWESHPSLSSD